MMILKSYNTLQHYHRLSMPRQKLKANNIYIAKSIIADEFAKQYDCIGQDLNFNDFSMANFFSFLDM